MTDKLQQTSLIPSEKILNEILFIRGKKVMLDKDLAELYQVETRVLIQAVKRNIKRFPSDFMFQLNTVELENWRSQIVISNSWVKMGLRKKPYAFTEQGVAMLSSVLNSERAIQVNIQIIRTFTKLRELLATNKELREKVESIEKKYDYQLKKVFEVLKQLLKKEEPKEEKSRALIGFRRQ